MRRAAPALALLAVLVTSWQILHGVLGINSLLLPTPTEVATAWVENLPRLVRETGVTMGEAVLGFLLGSAVAFLTAVIFIMAPLMERAIYPYAIALKATPLIVIAPLLVAWFGNGFLSKVAMSAVIAFFPVLVNAISGMSRVHSGMLDLMASLSASQWQVLRRVRIPSSLPLVLAGLRTSSSLAVVGAIIAEFTGSTRGIGHLINTSSYYLQTDLVFAAIIMISLAGIAFFYAIAALEKRVVFWGALSDN
jgi:NitT/TauT family transport system permease protein